MSHKMPISVLLIAGAIAAILLVGCGESKADKASAQVCDARDDIAKQVETLQGLTATTATTSQVKDSLQAISDDLSKIADAQGDLSGERRKQVQAANDEFANTVKETAGSVGQTVSIESAAAKLKGATQQLAASYKSTYAKLDCG